MPRHVDATGFLNELSNEVGEAWFTLIADLVAFGSATTLDNQSLQTLVAIYTKNASYIRQNSLTPISSGNAAPKAIDFLEELSSFSHFKGVRPTLKISFNKRITLIFGANGSGKSSVCEALKVLANRESPARPLKNAKASVPGNPSFTSKFKSETAGRAWTVASPLGTYQTTIKYFDTAIALKNVKDAVDPGRVIALAPFKLHVFSLLKSLTTQLRNHLLQLQRENAITLSQDLVNIRQEFANFEKRPLATIDETSVMNLLKEVNAAASFAQQDVLVQKQAAESELAKAASEDGLKILRAEHRDVELFVESLASFLDAAANLWALQPVAKTTAIQAKRKAQEALANTLVPSDGTLDDLLKLLRALPSTCDLHSPAGHDCPLCKRALTAVEVQLFQNYHTLLAGELETAITLLKAELSKAVEFATTTKALDTSEWDKCSALTADKLAEIKALATTILLDCDVTKEPSPEAQAALTSLQAFCAECKAQLHHKAAAIGVANMGREEVNKQLARARAEIEPLEYLAKVAANLNTLTETLQRAVMAKLWTSRLPEFTQILKKITETAKRAYEELVVADFETRLDAEYKALTEKSMATFGVVLDRKGSDATVTVLPQIGGSDIGNILSEGEQRVHALALFFAETETCSQSILVFDDPVSSFDYNYISNYCTRLRDCLTTFQDRQAIILTHNWEFFVQLQTTLNGAGLNHHLSVQVLENCAVVADYSEKIDELKADITAILAQPGEPTVPEKEALAGKMRRLIESVVNTHVFNNQRHQYKQKSQPVSEFHHFTRIIPLLPAEATLLKDLYGKLSISEHDDPRNAYVNTDKATFQSRYTSIVGVESSIAARR